MKKPNKEEAEILSVVAAIILSTIICLATALYFAVILVKGAL